MRTLLRTLSPWVAATAILFASVSLAVATSKQTVPRATDDVYPCEPSQTGSTSSKRGGSATSKYYGTSGGGSSGGNCVPCPPKASTPNQGNSSMVFKVDNPNVPGSVNTGPCKCENPQPLTKVEGNLGKTIYVSASKPIDFVTIKSGTGARLVSASWQIYNGTIMISKDVSNYVVWVCP